MRKVVIYNPDSGEISCCSDVQLPLDIAREQATDQDWQNAINEASKAAASMGLGCIEGFSRAGQLVVDGAIVDRAQTLAALKASRWGAMKRQRDLLEASGFPYLGKRLDSDARSAQRITTAVQAAQAAMALNQPFSIVWTCADNSLLTLDGRGMLGVPVALALYADQLHQTCKALRAQIAAATTVPEVEAIAWPAMNPQE